MHSACIATVAVCTVIFILPPPIHSENSDLLADLPCSQENGYDDESQCSEIENNREVAAELARRSLADDLRRRQAAFAARAAQTKIGSESNQLVSERLLTDNNVRIDATVQSDFGGASTLEDAARAWAAELGSESATGIEEAAASGTPEFTEIGATVIIPAGLTEGQVGWLLWDALIKCIKMDDIVQCTIYWY